MMRRGGDAHVSYFQEDGSVPRSGLDFGEAVVFVLGGGVMLQAYDWLGFVPVLSFVSIDFFDGFRPLRLI